MGVKRHLSSLPEASTHYGGSTLSLVNGTWRLYAQRFFQWAVVAATVAVLVNVGAEHGSNLSGLDLRFDPFWLVNAAIATTAANLLLPLGWRDLVASFGDTVTRAGAVRLWCFAQCARYLPTGLFAVASRLQLAAKQGISRAATVSSMAIEMGALLCWAAVICALFVPSTTLPIAVRWAGGAAAALTLVSAPFLISYIGQRLSETTRVFMPKSDPRLIAKGLTLLGVSVATRAIGTVCLAAGFLQLDAADTPLVIGATYAAIVAGMVGVTPAGLGVREGVMTAILAKTFGLADAAAFALMTRAWEFTFEMLFLAVASWVGRRRKSPRISGMDSQIPDGRL